MPMTSYLYTKTVNPGKLDREIRASAVTVALDHIGTSGTALTVYMKDPVGTSDKAILDGVVNAHVNSADPFAVEPTDSDGSKLVRPKATKTGWFYQVHSIGIQTATLNGIYNKTVNVNTGVETDLGFTSSKFYNAAGVQLTTAESMNECVQTQIDWSAAHDMEIRGGTISQGQRPIGDLRMWVVTAPNLVNAFFIQGGMNLRHMQIGNYSVDGETAKFLPGNTTPGGVIQGQPINRLRMILKHDAGLAHPFQLTIHLYKP